MVLILQIFWAIGCIAWNAYGLYLIGQGQAPIGPNATAAGAVACAVFAWLFWLMYNRQTKWPYILLCAITGIMAAVTIYGAFIKDLALWPSEFWRWAGIMLNVIGTVAAIVGIVVASGWQRTRS